MKPIISIIAVCYNEEKNLPFLIKELNEAVKKIKKDCEIIFVDDGSTDKTFDCLGKIKGIKNI